MQMCYWLGQQWINETLVNDSIAGKVLQNKNELIQVH